MTEPIAERRFTWRGPAGNGELRVQLGRPAVAAELHGDWRCPLAYAGAPPGTLPAASWAAGVDSLQALLLAAQRVYIELRFFAQLGYALSWDDDPDLGMPDLFGMGRAFEDGAAE